MSTAQAIIRQDGEGEQLWFAGGGVFTIKASAAETGGAFMLFEDRVVRGKTTPMHLHPDEDETIYVLEGELLSTWTASSAASARTASSSRHAECPTRSSSPPRRHAWLACIRRVPVSPSTATLVSPVSSASDAARPPDLARLRDAAERSETIELLGRHRSPQTNTSLRRHPPDADSSRPGSAPGQRACSRSRETSTAGDDAAARG